MCSSVVDLESPRGPICKSLSLNVKPLCSSLVSLQQCLHYFMLKLLAYSVMHLHLQKNESKLKFELDSCSKLKLHPENGRPMRRFWTIISASINIFAPNLVPRRKFGSPRGPSNQKSGYQKSKITAGRHLEFQRSYYNSVVDLDYLLKILYDG